MMEYLGESGCLSVYLTLFICQPIWNSATGDHWLADSCQLINSRKQAFQQKLLASLTQQSYAEKPDNKALKSPIRKLKPSPGSKIWQLDSTNLTCLLLDNSACNLKGDRI